MCTVTYLPSPTGFTLTHNRDEAPSRSPQSIVKEKTRSGVPLLFPRDTKAGGTWIATSRQGSTACLLNGAFVLHRRKPPYRRSRGIILLDFFDWKSPDDFFQSYDFERIEPFTMLFFRQNQLPDPDFFRTKPSESLELSEGSLRQITEFRWDGEQRHLKNLNPNKPHFWCSATLYPPEMQILREQVFRNWLTSKQITNKPVTDKQITQLHLTGSVNDPENDFVMNRGGAVQTVSLTQIIVDEKNARMRYLDLLGGNRSERRLSFSLRAAFAVNR